jgi:CDP-6-deoxy-D-xylo-4-hexulose-3-dehydrase
MFWKLQENIVHDAELDELITFTKETKRFTQFTKVKEFEKAYAEWQGCRYCVFVNSGSSANLVLVNALKEMHGWLDGDEVIVPAVTWPTTVTPVMQFGLKPVFVDANLSDLSFDYDHLERSITPRTRAIFVAHLLGFPADMRRLNEIAKAHDLVVIEDCCESHGAKLDGVKVGNMGAAGTFSFYWGHHITSIEGGMICTDDEELYKMCVLKRSHGLARELPAEYHPEIKARYPDIDFSFLFLTDGFNFRNTEFNAVLGLIQLKSLDNFIKIRNRNYLRFVEICSRYPDDLITLKAEGISSFALPFLFRNMERKKAFQEVILAAGIESRPLISGNLLRQPFLRQFYIPKDFPNADFLHTNAFYVGNNQYVGDDKLQFLGTLLRDFFGHTNAGPGSNVRDFQLAPL